MEKTIFSNRIYKNTLQPQQVASIAESLVVFNRAKHKAYELLRDQHNHAIKYSISVHMQIKSLFKLNDYYTASAVGDAKAQLSSQLELQKTYVEGWTSAIKKKHEKVADTTKRLALLSKMHEALKQGKFVTWRGSNITEDKITGVIAIRFKKNSLSYANHYLFEKQYLLPEIKKLKTRIALIESSIPRVQQKIDSTYDSPAVS